MASLLPLMAYLQTATAMEMVTATVLLQYTDLQGMETAMVTETATVMLLTADTQTATVDLKKKKLR